MHPNKLGIQKNEGAQVLIFKKDMHPDVLATKCKKAEHKKMKCRHSKIKKNADIQADTRNEKVGKWFINYYLTVKVKKMAHTLF